MTEKSLSERTVEQIKDLTLAATPTEDLENEVLRRVDAGEADPELLRIAEEIRARRAS